MHAYLTRFVISGDPTFQHIAIWTLLQLLESGDKKLMDCIAKATDIVEAIKTISEREIPADAEETGPKIDWTRGPAQVDIGNDIARIDLPEGYSFAGADDARNLLRSMGNRPSGNELGLLIPNAEDQDWFIVFSWQSVGYVKDDEKDKIDADALLESIQEATEAGNDWRKENHIPAMHVTGWAEPPRYDQRTNNLVWATLAESEGGGSRILSFVSTFRSLTWPKVCQCSGLRITSSSAPPCSMWSSVVSVTSLPPMLMNEAGAFFESPTNYLDSFSVEKRFSFSIPSSLLVIGYIPYFLDQTVVGDIWGKFAGEA